jgi:hypothetical protein
MKTWTTIDKSDWGDGPWQVEPDKMVWIDLATDLDCMIHRNRVGALCGYVGVPPDHPAYGCDYDNVEVDVHGGLTFASKCHETATEEDGICHVPEPGRPHDVWWLGFDCAHGCDYMPEMVAHNPWHHHWPDETYKDVSYVTTEVASLARQLKEMA